MSKLNSNRASASTLDINDQLLDNLVDEVCVRLQRGEPFDLEQMAAAHPEMADQLRTLYPTLRAITNLDEASTEATDGSGSVQTMLGDFRILRQIGRGGMGVVYEAEQISIPRRVALKVLPLASLVDSRALQRFKNEVAAVATLEHPNIVPVYAVGEDRGIHFYAMKLIRGQSLATVIRELRARADRQERLSGDAIQQAISGMAAEKGSGLFCQDGPPGAAHKRALTPFPEAASGKQSRADMVTEDIHHQSPNKQNDDASSPSPPLSASTSNENSSSPSSPSEVNSPDNKLSSRSPPLWGRGLGEGAKEAEEAPAQTEIETRARGRSSTIRRVGDATYFRNVAKLIQQAAEALQHAHDHGIVHRDIKPGNLLLDAQGQLYVTDFGLARIETGAGVTMTGDVLGTLRYMSPEQVQSNRQIVDHRTDIYSLGATLYELLTLQPMWASDDKAELIRKISNEEPIQLRKINPTIPTDLETIVLKAIRKASDDRYTTATEMASDLRSYLEQKPIIARRLTVPQRINRWARRNPSFLLTSGAILVLAAFGLIVSNLLIIKQKNIAVRKTDEAKSQTDRAERNLDSALEAVERMLTRFADEQLLNTPRTERIREQLYNEALEMLTAIIANESSHPSAQRRNAAAHFNVGRINQELGNSQIAKTEYTKSIELWNDWLEAFPTDSARLDVEKRQARAFACLGSAMLQLGDAETAQPMFQRSMEILEQVISRPNERIEPNVRQFLARTHVESGDLLCKIGNPAKGIPSITSGVQLLQQLVNEDSLNADHRIWLAWSLGHLAASYREQGELSRAIEYLEKARDTVKTWAAKSTDIAWANVQLAETLRDLGALVTESKPNRAKILIEEAVTLTTDLSKQFPDVPKYASLHGDLLIRLGHVHEQLGRFDQAIDVYELAIQIRNGLAESYPEVPEWHNNLAWTEQRVASLLYKLGRYEDGAKMMEKAISRRQLLATRFGEFPEHRMALAIAYESFATYQTRYHEDFSEAETTARRGMAVLEELSQDFPQNPFYAKGIVDLYDLLGAIALEDERFSDAKAEIEKAMALATQLATSYPLQSSYDELLMRLQANLATCHCTLREWTDAEKIFKEEILFAERQIASEPHEPAHRFNCAAMHINLSKIYQELQSMPLAAKHRQSAIQLYRELLNDFPQNQKIKSELANEFFQLACIHALNGESAVALDTLEQAIQYGFATTPEKLTATSDLNSIQNHKRWAEILERIRLSNPTKQID